MIYRGSERERSCRSCRSIKTRKGPNSKRKNCTPSKEHCVWDVADSLLLRNLPLHWEVSKQSRLRALIGIGGHESSFVYSRPNYRTSSQRNLPFFIFVNTKVWAKSLNWKKSRANCKHSNAIIINNYILVFPI